MIHRYTDPSNDSSASQSNLARSRWLISLLFSLAILLAGILVLQPFLLAILWAAIIAISSWRLHRNIYKRCRYQRNVAAVYSTVLIGFALVTPLVLLITFAVRDVITLSNYLIEADENGVVAPIWLNNMPFFGEYLTLQWNTYLTQPNQVSGMLRELLLDKLSVIQATAQSLLFELTGRVATLFFALWVLFFFYRDGASLLSQLNLIGYKWLERRWPAYLHIMPNAIRAVVNGLILVAVAEAALLALLFYVCGIPSAVLLGALLAILAFVPMLAPLLLLIIGLLLFASGSTLAAVVLLVVGNTIILAADYVVRPALIQGGTQLPFIAILFGIFGGIITMGIVGLIIGPVILVALLIFCREASLDENTVNLDFNPTAEEKNW